MGKVFIPVRHALWGNFEKNVLTSKTAGVAPAVSLTLKGTEGADLFAIEDGEISDLGAGTIGLEVDDNSDPATDRTLVGDIAEAIIPGSQLIDPSSQGGTGGDRTWIYGRAQMVGVSDGAKVKAGQLIGKVFADKPLTLSVRNAEVMAGDIELPQDPDPMLNRLGVSVLPQDAASGDLATTSELTSETGIQGKMSTGTKVLVGVGIVGGLYVLYRVLK